MKTCPTCGHDMSPYTWRNEYVTKKTGELKIYSGVTYECGHCKNMKRKEREIRRRKPVSIYA